MAGGEGGEGGGGGGGGGEKQHIYNRPQGGASSPTEGGLV